MTTVWICQRPNGEITDHDTEREALSEAALYSTGTTTNTKPVVYPVVIEPPVRRWRKSA